ncbi:MAG: PD40 domain-containing protein [Caldilineaceae bacterium]|nr:PD40 domain-containing protein [Caldilineaceae bacterium]
MNRERIRSGKATSPLHRLVNAEPEGKRPGGRLLLMMSIGVMAGVIGALFWITQIPRGALETLPDQAAQATSTTMTPTVAAPAVADAGAMLPSAAGGELSNDFSAGTNVGAGAANLFAQLAPVQQVTLVPPTPTATSTPMPPLASVEAVVAIGGAEVWNGDTGLLAARAPQGALFTATARSEDGLWLYGSLEDGAEGWVAAEQLIVFDGNRLASQAVVIMPITPTPTGSGSAAMPTAQAGSAATEVPVLRPTPVAGEAPLAEVALQDSRLNLRAGPNSSYAVIAKAMPNERFAILGRDATSKWLQLALPDVVGGFGWAAAEFLTTDEVIADLPVVNEVSNAPDYKEQQNVPETKGGQPAPVDAGKPVEPNAQGALYRPAGVPASVNEGSKVVTQNEKPAAVATGLSGKLAIQVSWGGDIYLYDLATAELRLLTGGYDPAISPDGKQVAFTRVGGQHGLYLINVDGSNERLIFSERTQFRSPKWSPDGQYILFERGDEFLNCTLSDPDDPASACLIDREPENATETQQKLARVDVNGNNYQDIPVLPRARVPDWNSAGIVYQSPGGIQMTQDQPGAQTKLVFFNIRKQYELDPDWQPNGGRIIFQRRENDHWEIYSVAADGSGLTALTHPNFTLVEKLPSNVAPAWSPDGNHIVFLSNRQPNQSAGVWGVWVMDADGGNQRRLDIDLPFIYTFVAEQMLDWGR